ncbi:hypothetical protein [Alkalibacillus almallahensis]|nr:hypothetical protein [Alkalibacillus almallahensis]NIK10898.1 hypothetical protein [Alkalibacillus almallahensis]
MHVATAYALIWLSCSIAVSTGIIVTGSLMPLWTLVIPALISVDVKGD